MKASAHMELRKEIFKASEKEAIADIDENLDIHR